MGREQFLALIRILESQLELGPDGVVIGSWVIHYDQRRQSFLFDKCEFGEYCEERPAVVRVSGEVLDPGGPLLAELGSGDKGA